MTLRFNPHAKMYPNRRALLGYVWWPPLQEVAEIGVAYGKFSKDIIDILAPKTFHAIDTFNLHTFTTMWGSNIDDTLQGKTHLDYYREKIPGAVCCQADSWDALAAFVDDSLDFAYLDADHHYDSVVKDIEQLQRVIKPGGYIMFDDYTNYDPLCEETYGVLQAVNEFLEQTQWPIMGMSLEYNGFHNLLIRKPK